MQILSPNSSFDYQKLNFGVLTNSASSSTSMKIIQIEEKSSHDVQRMLELINLIAALEF